MKNYSVIVDESVDGFLTHASELLYAHESVNGLMLGLIEGQRGKTPTVPPLLLRVVDESGTTLTAAVSFRKNPMNIILTLASNEQLQLIVEHLQKIGEKFTGVVGPRGQVEFFAAAWKKLTGAESELAMGQFIYKIEQVKMPSNVPGQLRVASHEDLPTVFQWTKAFVEESLPHDKRTDKEWQDFAEVVIQRQGAHLWLVDGKPVSMAVWSRPTQNGVSISGVYTPPELRKKGYASAVVASLSQKMLSSGKKFCVLYTDAANPTSNKIYQEVGYREVCQSRHLNFK